MSVYTLCCQVGPEWGGHRHKGPNGTTKDMQEAPLRLGEPQRGSPFSLPVRRDAHSRGRGSGGAMCHRLACVSRRHSHININKHAYVGMCKDQPGSSPASSPSHLHTALRAKPINAVGFCSQIFLLFNFQMSSWNLNFQRWACCWQTAHRFVHGCGNLAFFFCPRGHGKWVKRPWKCSKHRCAPWPVLKGCTEP